MMIILSMMMSFYQRNSNTKDPSKLANNTRPAIKKFNSRKGNQNLHPPTEKNKKKKNAAEITNTYCTSTSWLHF